MDICINQGTLSRYLWSDWRPPLGSRARSASRLGVMSDCCCYCCAVQVLKCSWGKNITSSSRGGANSSASSALSLAAALQVTIEQRQPCQQHVYLRYMPAMLACDCTSVTFPSCDCTSFLRLHFLGRALCTVAACADCQTSQSLLPTALPTAAHVCRARTWATAAARTLLRT